MYIRIAPMGKEGRGTMSKQRTARDIHRDIRTSSRILRDLEARLWRPCLVGGQLTVIDRSEAQPDLVDDYHARLEAIRLLRDELWTTTANKEG